MTLLWQIDKKVLPPPLGHAPFATPLLWLLIYGDLIEQPILNGFSYFFWYYSMQSVVLYKKNAIQYVYSTLQAVQEVYCKHHHYNIYHIPPF